MGLFTKKSPAEKLAGLQQKAAADAAKAGVDVTGALAVAHSINRDHAYVTLVVRPERVEVINHGRVGSPMKQDAGTVVVPVEKISAVSTRQDAGRAVLVVEYGGHEVTYWTSHTEAPVLADTIRDLMP